MLLQVDFSDLRLRFDCTDVRVPERAEFSVGELLNRLCEGVEQIGGQQISNKMMLDLIGPDGRRVDAARRVCDLQLNDWDTIYIVRRR